MNRFSVLFLACMMNFGLHAQQSPETVACGPVPSENQLRWQEMEMYAFIHYSLNTYTDQEWGFGNEDPKSFNPSNLDCRQWARVCKQAGMKGIIFTAKHHCGFCMWPSKYTEYSVKNSPWKNGQGDVVRELAEACKEEGLEYAVYLSPWDRNHPDYGKPAYVTYFRNQLRELLTEYGDMFEVWFDGANGGDGWYGGANEVRKIDRTTYYEWPETYKMIRELQPKCLIWNDGSDRGDLRWVGTEAGNIGETNWSLLNHDGEVTWPMLHYGLEDGDSWVPGETNTSIRPGWFYHETENENVKSLSKLMDTYYKSVGRNSTLLLNFPIAPNGRIHPTDSLRGIAFNKMIQEVFKTDLAKKAKVKKQGTETTITFKTPTTFNRFVAEEDIRYGQRVKKFSLEAEVDGKWVPLKDELAENGDGLTTIGHRRIICFPTVNATKLRFTILDAKCEPIIKRTSVYLAPDITQDIPDSGEKHSSDYYIFFGADKVMFVTLNDEAEVTGFRYLPPQDSKEGLVTHYRISATTDWQKWETLGEGEFSNIVNNPIWQTVRCRPTRAKVIRVEGLRLAQGERMGYSDVEVLTDSKKGAQRTPTMGWSSWNTFALNINEQLIRQQADAMHNTGLQKAGYKYVNIDDGYWDGRAEDGHLRLNTNLFPNGMRAMVDYIHSLGLKAGIYSDAGDNTCGSAGKQAWGLGVGFAGHENEDCQLYFRDWDFDFIKVDYCGGAHMRLDEREQYTKISNAIKNCGKKDVVFNICRWAFPGTWSADVADSWRTTGDIYDAWKSVKGILAENLYMSAYCHDGHYNDMDMLEVGRSMSETEDETHFGMWCIMSSPLLIGCDMANIKPAALKLMCNSDLIALNQDCLHLQAYVADKQGECFILVKDIKKLGGKERAVAIYNPSDQDQKVTIDPKTIDLGGNVQYYDCFTHTPYLYTSWPASITVPAHGTKIYRVKGQKRLERTRYEAETAWLSCYQELRNNQAEGSAIYEQREGVQGGYIVRFLGNKAENDLQWQHVNVEKAGQRKMTIACFSGEEREMDVYVNGEFVKTLKVPARDWNERQTITLSVPLKKGDNTIRINNPRGWCPDIDGMTLDEI